MTRTMLAYVRRSKKNRKRPDDPAYGIEAQRTTIRNAAAANDWRLVWAPADDGATGAHTRRAGLTWALDQLAAGHADGLVVAKLNRLSRSVADFAEVLRVAKKQRWSVVALDLGIDTSTVNGRLVANIVMSVAEWERDIISQRTVEALAEAKESGVKLGRPILVPKPIIRRIRRLRSNGHTLRAIADQLNADQVPTAHGGDRWHSSTIRGVLSRSGGDPHARTRPTTPAPVG
ncbi:recombinase family protein [Micromonospora sp. NPDC007220]|uniref:recombinase family protein n=1 Tax=Micromonospora sp. NPDC007220 TaxID=3154318 RepID=UPI0033EB7907